MGRINETVVRSQNPPDFPQNAFLENSEKKSARKSTVDSFVLRPSPLVYFGSSLVVLTMSIKIIVMGVGGVGKSAITNRFVIGRWVEKVRSSFSFHLILEFIVLIDDFHPHSHTMLANSTIPRSRSHTRRPSILMARLFRSRSWILPVKMSIRPSARPSCTQVMDSCWFTASSMIKPSRSCEVSANRFCVFIATARYTNTLNKLIFKWVVN